MTYLPSGSPAPPVPDNGCPAEVFGTVPCPRGLDPVGADARPMRWWLVLPVLGRGEHLLVLARAKQAALRLAGCVLGLNQGPGFALWCRQATEAEVQAEGL